MARLARFKMKEDESWYHVYSRASGEEVNYPLKDRLCQRKMIEIIKHFTEAYMCEVGAFCIMGNHYHIVLRFASFRKLSREELIERAVIFYPNSSKWLKSWIEEDWARFEERIFDLSEYMRNVQSAFARWYNRTYRRFGRLWADRFKSLYLEDLRSVLDCVLYVELNPVRAGLVSRPEVWKGSSCYLRDCGTSDWIMPLGLIMNEDSSDLFKLYRGLLYYRGGVPTKEGQASISEEIIREEEERGFVSSGMYRKRLRYFVDGVILGSEGFIRQQLQQMRETGHYLRRKNPTTHLDGIHLTLREQRSHAVCF